MNTKVILASLAGFVVSFLFGWLVFGMLLKGYFAANITNPPDLWKADPKMLALVLFNLAWGGLMGWSLHKMGVVSVMGGIVCGAIIAMFFEVIDATYHFAFMNFYRNRMVAVVDILVTTGFGAVIGGVVGAVLGTGKPANT